MAGKEKTTAIEATDSGWLALITDEEKRLLREYLSTTRILAAQEPKRITDEEWDYILKQHRETGEIPQEYAGRVCVRDSVDKTTGAAMWSYSDVALEEYGEKFTILMGNYHDVITHVLPTIMANLGERARNFKYRLIDGEENPSEEIALYKVDDLIELEVRDSKTSARDRAIEKGALMSIGGRVAAFSLEELKSTLTGDSIFRLPTNADASKVFDGAGKLNTLAVRESDLETLTEYHAAFLMSVLGMVEAASIYDDEESSKIEFYMPSILDELGIDPRPYSKKRENGAEMEQLRIIAMLNLILPFNSYVGRMPDNSGFYRVLAFSGYDAESETVIIDTPYLFKLKRYAESIRKSGKPTIHRYLHGSVTNEPNKAAVELASRIASGLARRGTKVYEQRPIKKKTRTKTNSGGTKETVVTEYDTPKTDGEPKERVIPYEVKYSTLIEDCPLLRSELDAIMFAVEVETDEKGEPIIDAVTKEPKTRPKKNRTQAYNAKLKQTFEQAYSIIENKSDIPQKFIGLTIPTKMKRLTVKHNGETVVKRRRCYEVPTKTTLSKKLVITYTGKVKEK